MSSINQRPRTPLPVPASPSDPAQSDNVAHALREGSAHSGAHSGDAQHGDAALALAAQQRLGASEAEVFTSVRVTRAPGNPEATPVASSGALGAQASLQHAALGVSPDANNTLVFKGDRTGGLATFSHAADGATTTGSAGMAAGNVYAEASHQFASGDRLTLGTINGNGVHGLGPTFTQTIGQTAVVAGFFAVGDAKVKARITETLGNEALVTYTEKGFKALQVTAGASSGAVGGGVRFYGGKTKEVVLKRWMDKKVALKAQEQTQTYLSKKIQALRLNKTPVFVMPDLQNPLNDINAPNHLRVNDEVAILTTGFLTGGLAAALGGVYLSAHLTGTRDWILRVYRVSEEQVKVSISPSSNKTLTGGIAADLPLLGTLSATSSRNTSKLITYVFDIAGEHGEMGLAAYRDMLNLKVPESLPVVMGGMLHNSEAILSTLADRPALPAGITFVSMQQLEVPRQDTFMAAMTGPRSLLGSKLGSMSITLQKNFTQSVWASGLQVYERTEAKRLWSSEAFRPGPTTILGSAAHVATTSPAAEAPGLLRGDLFRHNDTVYLEAEQTFAAPKGRTQVKLAQWALGHGFTTIKPSLFEANETAKGYSYGLVIKREINTDDLIQLARSYNIKGAATLEADLAHPEANTRKLLAPTIRLLQRWVGKNGVKAISQIHQNLGAQFETLRVSFKSNTKEKLTAEVNQIIQQLAPKMSARNLAEKAALEALTAQEKLQEKVAQAMEKHTSDTFMKALAPEDYHQKSADLLEIQRKVNTIVDIKALTANQRMTVRVVANLAKKSHVIAPTVRASQDDESIKTNTESNDSEGTNT